MSSYKCLWKRYDLATAVLTISSTPPPSIPTITIQPSDLTLAVGASASFQVGAVGFPAPTYQWQRLQVGSSVWRNLIDDGSYSGVTTVTLTVARITAAMNGDDFRCVVANPQGSIESAFATLTVALHPVIIVQPQNQIVNFGDSVTFTSVATGISPLAFQWQKDGTSLLEATSPIYSISAVRTSDSGSYSVVVSNASGSVASSNAILTVRVPFAFSTLAGSAGTGTADGVGNDARFNGPMGVTVDLAGNVYVLITTITSFAR